MDRDYLINDNLNAPDLWAASSYLHSSRWSCSDYTPCGIRAFGRPCQALAHSEQQVGNFPFHRVCAADQELVLVVEDDEYLRAELLELVSSMGYAAVGCDNADAFGRYISRAQTGCLILDIRLQGGDGVSILERAKEIGSALPAIMLTGMADPLIAAECIKIGAIEYIMKPANEIALRRAIDKAIGLSRTEFCMKMSKLYAQRMLSLLTPSESIVAEMLSKGYTTKQIAGELDRSENTIKIHRHKILSKLRINTVASISNIYNHVK